MFNFTPAENKAILFTILVILVSGIYQIISPHKSLKPKIDYSESDSTFKRLSRGPGKFDSTHNEVLREQKIEFKSNKKQKAYISSSAKKTPLEKKSININLASEKELQKLPNIGPAKAALIIKHRNTFGKFNQIEDLLKIKGIGKKTLEKLRPYIII